MLLVIDFGHLVINIIAAFVGFAGGIQIGKWIFQLAGWDKKK